MYDPWYHISFLTQIYSATVTRNLCHTYYLHIYVTESNPLLIAYTCDQELLYPVAHLMSFAQNS